MAERNDHIAWNCAAKLLATTTVRVRENSVASIHSQPATVVWPAVMDASGHRLHVAHQTVRGAQIVNPANFTHIGSEISCLANVEGNPPDLFQQQLNPEVRAGVLVIEPRLYLPLPLDRVK